MWWRQDGGWVLRPSAANKFIDEVVARGWWRSAKCQRLQEVARKAAGKIMRATAIEVMRKQAYMMATLVQELRNEEQFMADVAIHDGHFGSRAEERGAVSGGFCEGRRIA